MKSYFDSLTEKNLHKLITDEKIKITVDNQKYFDELETKFPIRSNRIAWDQVKNNLHYKVKEKKEISNFFNKIIQIYPKIMDENIIVFGDNIDQAYIMRFSLFRNKRDGFFSIPQHTYVINEPDIAWCINHTFEQDLFFG